MGHSGLRAMVTSQLIRKFLVFQQSTEYRSCTHPSLIHFSPRGVAWSPNIRKSPQAPDQVKDSRYVDEEAKHPVGDESPTWAERVRALRQRRAYIPSFTVGATGGV